MMVETILESSQDFGMSNGALPQWKRELLQRRAARARPPPAPVPPAPAPPPPTEEDEELRYGPGIVKRLKSRYLSLALREAPRRRPSVLRRAASLEHLLDERPPPAPRASARLARPASLAAPPHAALAAPPARRESVKRARSVDALSRLDARDEPSPPQPQPLQPPPAPPPPPPTPPAPPPPLPRTLRPPRRPQPLLRDAERPPADVVRSTLRKFETAPSRRAAPAARVSAVLRGLEAAPRSSTPEPRARSPSPAAADLSAIDEPEGARPAAARPVSRAALDGIARAGSTVRYSFEAGARGSHLPPLAAANPVLLGRARASASPRRVGVIRPMPATTVDRCVSSPPPTPDGVDVVDEKVEEIFNAATPPPTETEPPPKKDPPPPTVAVEPVPRTPPEDDPKAEAAERPTVNGHASPARAGRSKIGAAVIERAWSGAGGAGGAWGGTRRARAPAPASTSVVFNFSDRKEVPDYIENDGIVLRASRRNRFKAGEAGIVVLRAEALAPGSDSEEEEARPPSPCSVRFVNDNVLINGRSSMAARPAGDRAARLKLQFDDSLTRTFEYPSETSLSEPAAPAQPAAQPVGPPAAALLLSPSLSQYTPSKTCADAFALGMARPHREPEPAGAAPSPVPQPEAEGDARPCAAESARSWSEARTLATDLLF